MVLALVSGCGDGGGTPPQTPGNTAPSITGAPATSVSVGQPYSFKPSATDPENNSLIFSVANKPSWVSFNATTGELTGKPTAADVASYTNIVISVSDGQASSSLSPFSIAVVATAAGSATLSWIPPDRNTDGTALVDLAGYRVYWSTTSSNFNNSIQLPAGVTSHLVEQLTPTTWYFAVSAFNARGVESRLSETAYKVVQ